MIYIFNKHLDKKKLSEFIKRIFSVDRLTCCDSDVSIALAEVKTIYLTSDLQRDVIKTPG
jgi:hypothetical protein